MCIKEKRNCKMSINLTTREKLQFISPIAFLLIIALAIDRCDCDQGKKDTFLSSQIHILHQPFTFISLDSLLFSIVDCCCWMQFLLL